MIKCRQGLHLGGRVDLDVDFVNIRRRTVINAIASEAQTPRDANKRDRYHHGDLRQALIRRAAEVIDSEGIEALTLRGLARDLGVSHGAPNRHFKTKGDLLAALATEGYTALREATLSAAESAGEDPWVRLNYMGRGFLRWAFENPASFRAITHPDVERYADAELLQATEEFSGAVRAVIAETQADGRHPEVDLDVLTQFTNAVPFGVAMMHRQGVLEATLHVEDREAFIAQVIELVCPIADRLAAQDSR
ncbi:MAG: TetR/AcrR family transcriptional regulator [Gammaproteobacteria bacterium]|nr:MAG: TetR/AcrR family transcriptional regulator [Gammaproteobacteria bacterium]